MAIKELSSDQIVEMSAVEISYMLMKEKNDPIAFHVFFKEIADLKKIPRNKIDDRRTKLFTTLNIDGRFVHLGNNHWGLKEWYPVDKSDEDLGNTFQAPESEEVDQEYENIEDELDEIANEDDADSDEKSSDEFDAFDDEDNNDESEEDNEEDEDDA